MIVSARSAEKKMDDDDEDEYISMMISSKKKVVCKMVNLSAKISQRMLKKG